VGTGIKIFFQRSFSKEIDGIREFGDLWMG
jgi:hypothetical protein